MGLKAKAVKTGTIKTLAVALINAGILLWQKGQQIPASLLFIAGGILFIVSEYYNLSIKLEK